MSFSSPFGDPAPGEEIEFADFSQMNPAPSHQNHSTVTAASATTKQTQATTTKSSRAAGGKPLRGNLTQVNLSVKAPGSDMAVIEVEHLDGNMTSGGATAAAAAAAAGSSSKVKITFWELSLWDLDFGDPRAPDYALSAQKLGGDAAILVENPSRMKRFMISANIWSPSVTRKFISDACGHIAAGKITCVASPYRPMGQAFLNLLAGTKTHGEVEGQLVVQYRGVTREDAAPGTVGFLEATHDALLRNLSVRRYLYLAGCIRSPRGAAYHSIMERVTSLLHDFGLDLFAKTKMAGGTIDSAIGRLNESLVLLLAELMGDPLILYADDPLDGLTADDAAQYMKYLKQVALPLSPSHCEDLLQLSCLCCGP